MPLQLYGLVDFTIHYEGKTLSLYVLDIQQFVTIANCLILLYSGVDVLGALESLGISERFMEPIRNSGAGYVALSLACYKVATPLRYAVTLGNIANLFRFIFLMLHHSLFCVIFR